jgi:hypothetical protein
MYFAMALAWRDSGRGAAPETVLSPWEYSVRPVEN